MEKESWCIREGFVTTFEALAQVLWKDQYFDVDKNEYLVRLTLIDAMGGTQRQTTGEGTRTSEVYDFCRMNRGRILPIKGEQRMNQPLSYSNINYYPATKKPIPGEIILLRINTTYFKNDLSNILDISPGDPGAWHYHSEVTDAWAQQLTSEYIDEKGIWRVMSSRANHAWDCAVYCLAAHDYLGVKYWPRPELETTVPGEPRIVAKSSFVSGG